MTPQDVLAVGCRICGASSHEPCVSGATSLDMPIPHGARIRFAAQIATTRTPEESPDE